MQELKVYTKDPEAYSPGVASFYRKLNDWSVPEANSSGDRIRGSLSVMTPGRVPRESSDSVLNQPIRVSPRRIPRETEERLSIRCDPRACSPRVRQFRLELDSWSVPRANSLGDRIFGAFNLTRDPGANSPGVRYLDPRWSKCPQGVFPGRPLVLLEPRVVLKIPLDGLGTNSNQRIRMNSLYVHSINLIHWIKSIVHDTW